MSESNLTPEELKEVELLIPAIDRKHKIDARRKLSKQLKGPAIARSINPGGVSSPLDPINPHKLREFGEPTIPLPLS